MQRFDQIDSIESLEMDSWTNSKLFRPKLSLNRTKNGLSGMYVFGHFKVLSYTYNTTTMNLADFDLIINLLLILICFAVLLFLTLKKLAHLLDCLS